MATAAPWQIAAMDLSQTVVLCPWHGGFRMVGFTWLAMVAAFHVVVMAVAADVAEIAECEEDEKREAAGNRCEGKRKNGFWVIWPSPNQTYIKNPKNPTQAQI